MKISVIMPIYNGEKKLDSAIKCILNQTFKDFEFIIVDDGSKDKSEEIIKKYSKIDNRIKLIKNKSNIGLTKSLNRAIKISKGKYIARQDDDDISFPERLQKQFEFLENNLKYAFCGCNVIVKQTKQDFIKFFDYADIKRNLIIKNCFIHPTILIRKVIFEKYGYYNEKYIYSQDYELWSRLKYIIQNEN